MGSKSRRDLKGRLVKVRQDLRFVTKSCTAAIPSGTVGVITERADAVQPSWHVLLPGPWHLQVLLEHELEIIAGD